jgi:glycopeptide antibiotics resistance protein
MNKYKILTVYFLTIATIIIVIDSGITAHFRDWLRIQIPNLDKVGHFFIMGIFTFLLLNAFAKDNKRGRTLLIITIAILMATIEEFSQKFLEYRSFQYWDLAANYLGITIFSILFSILKRKSINRKKDFQFYLNEIHFSKIRNSNIRLKKRNRLIL